MLALLLALTFGPARAGTPLPADAPATESPALTHLRADLTVAVTQREASAEALIAAAEGMGGWFAGLSDAHVDLRVPAARVDELVALAIAQGLVIERSASATDLSPRVIELRARLAAREAMLERYFAILPEASPKAVVAVEREIVGLVAEIEQIKGSLRVLEHQGAWGEVYVSFTSRDRSQPARDGSSSFAWLNTLNLIDLLEAFRYGQPSYAERRAGLPPLAIEGFSPYRRLKRERRAASPDKVVARVRAERHDPAADADFWKEAARERMVAAGYTLLREQDIEVAGRPGFALELTAPMGQSDHAYLVAVVPAGRKLYVFEAAGELTEYEARREALFAALVALPL